MKDKKDTHDLHHEPEEMELEDIEDISADKLKTLKQKLRTSEDERRKLLEEMQRNRADFLNSRKRLEDQLQTEKVRVREAHIETLLPLADSFDMAMQDPSWETCDEKWRKGIEAVYAQLMNIFKQNAVNAIAETGVPFNPHEHDAISSAPVTDEKEVDTVREILQKGYRMGTSIIRPAKVVVGSME